MFLANSNADPDREVRVVHTLEERRVDEIVVTASRVGGRICMGLPGCRLFRRAALTWQRARLLNGVLNPQVRHPRFSPPCQPRTRSHYSATLTRRKVDDSCCCGRQASIWLTGTASKIPLFEA
jgi:hypothetical protein